MDRRGDPPAEPAETEDLRGKGYAYARHLCAATLEAMEVQPSSPSDAVERRAPRRYRVGVRSEVRVTSSWPEDLPITPEEVRVVEAWLGEVLDEVFGPRP